MDEQSAEAATATAAQMKALSHPSRVRLWSALGAGDATISQLANRLSLNKGNVAHHLKVLEQAGLVRAARSRTVRGGTEQDFTRTDRRLIVPDVPGGAGPGAAMMANIAAGVRDARDPRVHQRSIRLTPAQASALADHLDSLLHNLQPADDRHGVYEVVTAVYRRS